MNAFGAKLLSLPLMGLFALPVGFCCPTGMAEGDNSVRSERCCTTSKENPPSRRPAKAIQPCCCCQERIVSREDGQTPKRPSLAPFPIADTLEPGFHQRDLGTACHPQTHAYFESDKHSLQCLFCVWRQ